MQVTKNDAVRALLGGEKRAAPDVPKDAGASPTGEGEVQQLQWTVLSNLSTRREIDDSQKSTWSDNE